MARTFEGGFPVISQRKLEAARKDLLSQDLIEQVRITSDPLQIIVDSTEMLDLVGARETMQNTLHDMGFRFGFKTQPAEGDYMTYGARGDCYLANVVFAHGSPGDEGIWAAVYWERKLDADEHQEKAD